MLPSINKVLTYLLLTYNMYFIHQMLMHKVVFNPLILFLSLYHTCTTHNSFLLTWPFYFSHVEAKNSVSPKKLKCPLENCWLGQNVPQKWNPRSDTGLIMLYLKFLLKVRIMGWQLKLLINADLMISLPNVSVVVDRTGANSCFSPVVLA